DFEIVDSRTGVARRLAQIVDILDKSDETMKSPDEKGRFMLTSEPPFDPAYAQWAKRFDLLPPELL
ncbi:MAG: hypothetical protein CVV53_05575, partial [Spirochaetae bacterium HGW-Spirochaetae-9]